jgi:NAD-dependent SIR2 family protein deacetylase
MLIIETTEDVLITAGASIKVINVNSLPDNILKRTGARKIEVGDVGRVCIVSVAGFDSSAILVDLCDPWGEKIGRQCVLFTGEYERIPDLTPSD